ncbi:hypothetical protein TRFO_21059 [Tritrichomonas foetus]|uniref:Uncharacterized protein n=1 Tax=Tritrichomonas foetus TaxID=1144522 RepID=A0A1J4KJT2_9EUKA|nr:hypothetical protein TRFO_21059 [Tritrichomonas foetus]|eukprot:OHT09958.1 hypothetical protein TRFO_21059 [Tritrichomonas foetus]
MLNIFESYSNFNIVKFAFLINDRSNCILYNVHITCYMSYFVKALVDEKRFPVYFVFDCIVTCFALHAFFHFSNLFVFAACGILLPTFVDNFLSLIRSQKLEIIENPYLVVVSALIWVVVEFTPNGMAFDILLKITPIVAIFAGLNFGCDILAGASLAEVKFFKKKSAEKWIYAFILSILTSLGKYIIISAISALTGNHFRSMVTIVGEDLICAALACSRRNIAKTLNVNVKSVECFIIVLAAILNVGRTYLPDDHIKMFFTRYF